MPRVISNPQFPIVATTRGEVRGKWRAGTESRSAAFLGVPFAQPPVGKLRFAAPQPMKHWQGVLDCLDYGPTPLRDDSGETLIPEPAIPGDSTLNVNVFTPKPGDTSADLPVMVWIHGGGYTAGSPASPWYDGAQFNRDGVVVVTISYRLGFVGFGLVKGAPANRAVLDWLAALRWVQDNIAAFGGDPDRVTIAGQSAGGAAVLTLLGMECAQDLFSQALCISGILTNISKSDALKVTRRLCRNLGVPPTVQALNAVDETELLKAQQQAATPKHLSQYVRAIHEGMEIGPVVDGELLVQPTLESLRMGVGAGKPLLIGANDDEFSIVFSGQERLMNRIPRKAIARFLGLRGEQYDSYILSNDDVAQRGTARLMGHLVTDYLFRSAVLKVLHSRQGTPTWSYRFTATQPETDLSIHCLDVPYWFDCLNQVGVERLAGDNPSQELASTLHGFAVQFISQGKPGWPRWSPIDQTVEVIGDNLPQLGFTDPDSAATHVTVNDAYRGVRALLPTGQAPG